VNSDREGLGEGYDSDIGFANALESFGGGHNDPLCVAFGGTYLSPFVSLFIIWILSFKAICCLSQVL